MRAFHQNGPQISRRVSRPLKYEHLNDFMMVLRQTSTGSFGQRHVQSSDLLRKRQKGSLSRILFDSSDEILDKEREKLLSWLSFMQPELRHKDVNAKRSDGTGTWFINTPGFQMWSSLENVPNYHTILSLGHPGAGKTTLLYVFHQRGQTKGMMLTGRKFGSD